MTTRRTALTALLGVTLVLAAAILFDVLGTVFFAITVVALIAPLYERIAARGLPPWWAAVVTSAVAAVAALLPLAALAGLVYLRRDFLLGLARAVPSSLTLSVSGVAYTLDLAPVRAQLVDTVAGIVLTLASSVPVLSLKLTLFAILVFALVMHHGDARAALLAPVPPRYHDIADRLQERARATLYSIYVLQAATALATGLIALPVFFLLGYDFPLTLAFTAAILQFLPIVGPSVLIAALALWKLSLGDATGAVLLVLVAGVLVAWLPDILVRPRLSRSTANLPGSLYYVGFVGGLLTLGPVGIIAGPLVVALAVEAVQLLAEENRSQTTLS